MPAKAGIQNYLISLGSRLRGNDAKEGFKTFYENINVEHRITGSLRSANLITFVFKNPISNLE